MNVPISTSTALATRAESVKAGETASLDAGQTVSLGGPLSSNAAHQNRSLAAEQRSRGLVAHLGHVELLLPHTVVSECDGLDGHQACPSRGRSAG